MRCEYSGKNNLGGKSVREKRKLLESREKEERQAAELEEKKLRKAEALRNEIREKIPLALKTVPGVLDWYNQWLKGLADCPPEKLEKERMLEKYVRIINDESVEPRSRSTTVQRKTELIKNLKKLKEKKILGGGLRINTNSKMAMNVIEVSENFETPDRKCGFESEETKMVGLLASCREAEDGFWQFKAGGGGGEVDGWDFKVSPTVLKELDRAIKAYEKFCQKGYQIEHWKIKEEYGNWAGKSVSRSPLRIAKKIPILPTKELPTAPKAIPAISSKKLDPKIPTKRKPPTRVPPKPNVTAQASKIQQRILDKHVKAKDLTIDTEKKLISSQIEDGNIIILGNDDCSANGERMARKRSNSKTPRSIISDIEKYESMLSRPNLKNQTLKGPGENHIRSNSTDDGELMVSDEMHQRIFASNDELTHEFFMTEMNCSKDGIGAQLGPAGDREKSNTNPRNSATGNQKVAKLNMALPKNYQKVRNLSMQFPSNDIFNEALQQKNVNFNLQKKVFQPVLQERRLKPQRKFDASKSCNKPKPKPIPAPAPATIAKPKIIPKDSDIKLSGQTSPRTLNFSHRKEILTTVKKAREPSTTNKSPMPHKTLHKKTASMATQLLPDQQLVTDNYDKYNKPRARKKFDTEQKKKLCYPASKLVQSNRKLDHVKSRLDTG